MGTSSIARIVLLVLVLAFLVNVTRGTGTRWLRAKFIGSTT